MWRLLKREPDTLKRKGGMHAIVPWRTSSPLWLKHKEVLEELCTTSSNGRNRSASVTIVLLPSLMSGPVKYLCGHRKIRRGIRMRLVMVVPLLRRAQSTASTSTNIQPKKMPRPQQSGGASSSGYAAFRSGPGTSSASTEQDRSKDWIPNVDWMKKKKPSSVEVVIYAAEDNIHAEQRIAFLKAERVYVLSTIEGPHSTREFETNLQWKQYMRRMTSHAALTYNICTEGQLDSQMLNANEFAWLKLYHYISTTTVLVRCKGYPITEVLAMLTIGAGDTVPGDIRNNLKKLGNQIGQYIIKKPWSVQWDELGGQLRNNTSIILTDLTYQTKSSSRIVHDIETGRNNMGIAFLKVFQLPYTNPLRSPRNVWSSRMMP